MQSPRFPAHASLHGQALSARTGAGTICGGRSPKLAELTAETFWQTVYCLDVIERAPQVKSFRFEVPAQHGAAPVRPWQHLILQATIGGVDFRRGRPPHSARGW
jgi:hypothetical protein